jgi:hypothetical protein
MSTTPEIAKPAVITMDGAYLELAKQRIAAGDASLTAAYTKLMEDATALLDQPGECVTNKTIMPSSQDKHDYLSLAPYWWPDPEKADGLPFIQRDGEFNPSSKNGNSDSVRMQFLCMSCQSLSLAYYFSDDMRFANQAADYIRKWFLAPETCMNPNLNFGQAVMGRVSGRGTGLIDPRNFWMVIDAALLIAPSGALSTAELDALRAWFGAFTDWMLNSDIGIEEYNAHNNHGTFYDMQVACYALFAGDLKTSASAVTRARDLRIQAQICADGSMPAELERPTPSHYVAFNLDAMTNIARYGEQVGVKVWDVKEKTRGLRNGINFMSKFIADPTSWPYKELRRIECEVALAFLLKAERAYGGGAYGALAAGLAEHELESQEYIALYKAIQHPYPTTRNCVDLLMWPVK